MEAAEKAAGAHEILDSTTKVIFELLPHHTEANAAANQKPMAP